MILTNILQSDCIKVPLEGKDKSAVIEELLDLLVSAELITERDAALNAVMAREKTRSTGIGSGIAIPHGKCNCIKSLVMALGIISDGIDFQSVDEKPAKIIILLLSPTDKTGPHIQALAKIKLL